MSNPLRSPDPTDPFPPSAIVNEAETGVRHPNRFESRTSSIPNTQLVRNDAARVYRNSALSVANGATISWDVSTFDSTGIWNGSTLFTIPLTGKITGAWEIYAQIPWPGTGAGTQRQIEIRRNGLVLTTKSGPASTTYQDIYDTIYDPNRGDTYSISVSQDSGGALALTVGSDKMYFSMVHTG